MYGLKSKRKISDTIAAVAYEVDRRDMASIIEEIVEFYIARVTIIHIYELSQRAARLIRGLRGTARRPLLKRARAAVQFLGNLRCANRSTNPLLGTSIMYDIIVTHMLHILTQPGRTRRA